MKHVLIIFLLLCSLASFGHNRIVYHAGSDARKPHLACSVMSWLEQNSTCKIQNYLSSGYIAADTEKYRTLSDETAAYKDCQANPVVPVPDKAANDNLWYERTCYYLKKNMILYLYQVYIMLKETEPGE
jgi:hypothetical protein